MYAAPAAPKKPDLSNIKGDFEITFNILNMKTFEKYTLATYFLHILACFFFANIGKLSFFKE